MIRIEQSIQIEADTQIVWAFLSDISHSLTYNRFHTQIIMDAGYSIKAGTTFEVHHNFGMGSVPMQAEIIDCIPPRMITIREFSPRQSFRAFTHESTFTIEPKKDNTILRYLVTGTFSNKLKDAPFSPVLRGVMNSELNRLKQAIESSVSGKSPLEAQSVSPV